MTTATMIALVGIALRSLILARLIGSRRSKARANMTRVTTATKARSTASSADGTAIPIRILEIGSPDRISP